MYITVRVKGTPEWMQILHIRKATSLSALWDFAFDREETQCMQSFNPKEIRKLSRMRIP